jgi:hypothetical protein
MADVFTYYGCPMCGAEQASIDVTLGICKQCGYDGSESLKLTYQQTQNGTSHGNIAVSAVLPNGTVVTITGDRSGGITYSVPFGTRITLTSTAVAHYNHNAWTGEVSGTTGGALNITAKYTVKAATSYGATYAAHTVITWTCEAHGSVAYSLYLAGVLTTGTWDESNNGSLYVDNGTVLTLTQTPDTGYVHKTWACNRTIGTGNNSTLTIVVTLGAATIAIAVAQQALTATFDGFAYCNASGTPVIIRKSSTDGKNITVAITPPSGQAVSAAYTANVTDGDEVLTPTVSSNAFTMDLEEAKHYYCIVVFGAE